MATYNPTADIPRPTWLRGPAFDLTFVIGVAFIALLSGGLVLYEPSWFGPVLFIDLWVLGYHHVISTYTRLVFDTDSFREHRFLVIWLPAFVTIGCIAAGLIYGRWILATAYLYWQWFHYTRQSYGIARIYARKTNPGAKVDDRLVTWMIYSVPLWGILYRSYQAPERFLGMPLKVLPVAYGVVAIVGVVALCLVAVHGVREIKAIFEGRSTPIYSAYLLSHTGIFLVGYLAIRDIDVGWLVINVWHNAQYILLVWMFNTNRFKGGVDPGHRFLSTISQKRNMLLYFGVCLVLATGLYFSINRIITFVAPHSGFDVRILVLTIYSAINFHHYIVDGVIWKVRRKPLQKHLGVAT